MSNPFNLLYELFSRYKKIFLLGVGVLLSLGVYFSSSVSFQEDIAAFIPKDKNSEKFQDALARLKFNDRIIVTVYLKDSSQTAPDQLTSYAEELVSSINKKLDSTWIQPINYKLEEDAADSLFDILYNNLPYYLTEEDYLTLEHQLSDSSIENRVKENYERLLSSDGAVTKQFIIKDPLGLTNFPLKRLASLELADNIEFYDGYFVTKDRRNLFLYISTSYASSDVEKNLFLSNTLTFIKDSLSQRSKEKKIQVDFFGSPIISVGNITQIKNDALYTSGIALVLIFVVLYLYFRKLSTLVLLFLPVVVGALFSLSIIYLLKGHLSAIALGAGSIVLGIAIDYSLHYFTHLSHTGSVKKLISELTLPLTLGCVTTVGAFLCLQTMQAEVLQDMGLFAGLSLLGAALSCLLILPPLSKIEPTTSHLNPNSVVKFLGKLSEYSFHKNKLLLILVVGLTVFFATMYQSVSFETDMTKLSYMSPELQKIENRLDSINNYKLKSVFVISDGETLEEALSNNSKNKSLYSSLKKKQTIESFADPGVFLLTNLEKEAALGRWKQFWKKERISAVFSSLKTKGAIFNFNSKAFTATEILLTKSFDVKKDSSQYQLRKILLNDFVYDHEAGSTVITILKTTQESKEKIYKEFEPITQSFLMDRGSMATRFSTFIKDDFNFILLLSSTLIFSFLVVSYGRIELALLAFIPMVISWIWIIGIMGLFGLKFNIVNIILCTFIFGLGDDYSIFTIDGLTHKYKFNTNVLSSYRSSIFLSGYTTIIGIGVLIFSKHPALYSIALIAVIGIGSILMISMIVQPYLYDLLILSRKEKKKLPLTSYDILVRIPIYLGLPIVLTAVVLLSTSTNVNAKKKYLNFFHTCIINYSVGVEKIFGIALFPELCNLLSILPKRMNQLHLFIDRWESNKASLLETDFLRGKLIKNYIYKGPVLEWYTIIKIALEKNYTQFNTLLPRAGKIIDIGCGYGYLSYMLTLASKNREVIGIDYDIEKIEVANNGVLKSDCQQFFHHDVRTFEYPTAEAFVISDVLHYLREEEQEALIKTCITRLNPEGVLIIRDGNSDLQKRHQGTKLTEYFSTKLMGFNKVSIDELCFTSKEKLLSILSAYNVSVEIIDETIYTSNILLVIKKLK